MPIKKSLHNRCSAVIALTQGAVIVPRRKNHQISRCSEVSNFAILKIWPPLVRSY